MRVFLLPVLLLITATGVFGQSGSPASNTGSSTTSSSDWEQPKVKAKKIWTNDEIATAGGAGGISVVGKEPDGTVKTPRKNTQNSGQGPVTDKQIAAWRTRLVQLNNQLGIIDQKITELRNFKGDNGSVDGGIVLSHRYTMTPIEEQIKTQEDKKKSVQAEIDAIEEQARKNGVAPGRLR
jgi:hypothetical protein